MKFLKVGILHLSLFFVAAPALAVQINNGVTQDVTGPNGQCRKVTNASGGSLFVPNAGTTLEWTTFYSNYPTGVTIAACTGAPPPAGPTWYNAANEFETYAAACTRVGKSTIANQGYGTCASGENRPAAGTNFGSIVYRLGTFGTGNGGTGAIAGGTYTTMGDHCEVIDETTTCEDIGLMCYRAGQVTDEDLTDRVMAYLCD